MSKERKYGWNGEIPAKDVSGQQLIVLNGMRKEPEAMRTGHEWAEVIGPELKTRQDPYRVVLYYVLILKGKGCVRTAEFDIEAVTRKEDVKHGITVRTEGSVTEREVIQPPVEEPAAQSEEAAA